METRPTWAARLGWSIATCGNSDIPTEMQDNMWARLHESSARQGHESRNLAHIFSCIFVGNATYGITDIDLGDKNKLLLLIVKWIG